MPSRYSRRALLGTVALGAVSGCLSGLSNRDEDDDRTIEECPIPTGTWQGEADPLTTSAETTEGGHPERRCRRVAADTAFAELNRHLDADIENRPWADSVLVDDGEYRAVVRVTIVRNRDGSLRPCPESAFDVADARANLPSAVTVSLDVPGADEPHACTHEIALHVEELMLD